MKFTKDNKIHLVMFAKGEEYINCANKLKTKCLNKNLVNYAKIYTYREFQLTEFYIKNKKLIDSHRAGYWIWKPFIIKQYLNNLNYGDYLIYHDGGSEFYKYYINSFNMETLVPFLQKLSEEYDGLLPGLFQSSKHKEYCKQDCFHYMKHFDDLVV